MYAYAMLNPVLQMDLLGLDPVSTQRFLACLVRAAGSAEKCIEDADLAHATCQGIDAGIQQKFGDAGVPSVDCPTSFHTPDIHACAENYNNDISRCDGGDFCPIQAEPTCDGNFCWLVIPDHNPTMSGHDQLMEDILVDDDDGNE